MRRLKRYLYIIISCAAVVGCSDDPEINNNETTILDNGTVIANHISFTTQTSGFFDVEPENARSNIAAAEHEYWKAKDITPPKYNEKEDTDNKFYYMTATSVVPVSPVTHTTRAEDITNKFTSLFSNGLYVSGIYTKVGDNTKYRLFDADYKPFVRDNNTGLWDTPNNIYPWPKDARDVSLCVWTPLHDNYKSPDDIGDAASLSVENTAEGPCLKYHTPKYALYQQDLMAGAAVCNVVDNNGTPLNVDQDGRLSVSTKSIQMKHIMAGLRIRFSKQPGRNTTFKNIEIWNVPVRDGVYNIINDTWSVTRKIPDPQNGFDNQSDRYCISFFKEGTYGQDLKEKQLRIHEFTDVQTDEQTFMLIPQTMDASTTLVLTWTDGTKNYISLDGLKLAQGKITYLDIQECSIFVQGIKSFRETNNRNDPGQYGYGGSSSSPHFRLYDDPINGNYYFTDDWIALEDNWALPTRDEDIWGNDELTHKYFGHRLPIQILCEIFGTANPKGIDNIYYHAPDIRENFFIYKKGEGNILRYRYKEYWSRNINPGYINGIRSVMSRCREEYFRDWDGMDPNYWYTDEQYIRDIVNEKFNRAGDYRMTLNDISNFFNDSGVPGYYYWSNQVSMNNYAAPWYALGGEMRIKIIPDRPYKEDYNGWGYIEFETRSTAEHPLNYPAYISVCGSVDRFPDITIEPYTADKKYTPWPRTPAERGGNWYEDINYDTWISKWNNHSYRGSLLKLTNNQTGYYEGEIDVNQYIYALFDPSETGRHHFETAMKGYGLIALFASTIHGSLGLNVVPADNYEARLGLTGAGNPVYCNINNPSATSATITGFGHSYKGSFLVLPCGRYRMTYNMSEQTLTYTRIGDGTYKDFDFYHYPYDYLRNYHYDNNYNYYDLRGDGHYWINYNGTYTPRGVIKK